MNGMRNVTRFNDLFLYLAYILSISVGIHFATNNVSLFSEYADKHKKCQDTADTDVTIDPTCLELDYL